MTQQSEKIKPEPLTNTSNAASRDERRSDELQITVSMRTAVRIIISLD